MFGVDDFLSTPGVPKTELDRSLEREKLSLIGPPRLRAANGVVVVNGKERRRNFGNGRERTRATTGPHFRASPSLSQQRDAKANIGTILLHKSTAHMTSPLGEVYRLAKWDDILKPESVAITNPTLRHVRYWKLVDGSVQFAGRVCSALAVRKCQQPDLQMQVSCPASRARTCICSRIGQMPSILSRQPLV